MEVFHPVRRRHRPGAVRHDPALFRRGESLGRRRRRAAVDALDAVKASSSRPSSRSRSCSCSSATAPRSGWCRCTTGCPMRTPRARRRSRPCSPGCCSTSRSTRSCAARCWSTARWATRSPGNLMMGFGLALGGGRGVLPVAPAATSSACSPIRRSSTWGSMTFAFGMGGPVATFAGLLHMTVHSLTKSAIFFAVGHAAQKAGTQNMDEIRGLIKRQPDHRLGAHARHARDPRHAAVRRVRQRVPDPDDGDARAAVGDAVSAARARRSLSPRSSAGCSRWCSARRRRSGCRIRRRCCRCSCISRSVLMLGLYIPPYLETWYRQAARMIGG